MSKKKLTIVWETGDDDGISASITEEGKFLIAEVGDDFAAMRHTLLDLVQDYIAHEGQGDPEWRGLDAQRDIEYEDAYDLTTVFAVHPEVNVNALARATGMNPSLLRQYASGAKHVTAQVAHRIEAALRGLGARLSAVNIAVATS